MHLVWVVVVSWPSWLILPGCRYFVPNPAAAVQKKKDGASGDDVPKELELLKGITAFAEPGVLMALMGGSGAGKTTLMDVIAGRKTVGRTTGDIFVNGKPKDQDTFSRMCGYVEQV
jgi:ABC-type multidrug transport system ATPase subunit